MASKFLKCLQWRAVQKTKRAFEGRYLGYNTKLIGKWIRNINLLIPEKRTIDKLEGRTRGIHIRSVMEKWSCGCLTTLMDIERERKYKMNESVTQHTHLGLRREEVRQKLQCWMLAAAGCERSNDLAVCHASLNWQCNAESET